MGTILIEKGNSWHSIFAVNRPMTASEEQKAALARVLRSRYHKLCAGELYRIDGWPLKEPTEAITVDTGMILIGLSECLGCSAEAENTLRQIIILFFASLGLSSEVRRSIDQNRLDIRYQLKMLQTWTRNRERSPLAAVLSFAAALLFPDEAEIEQNGDQTLTYAGRALFSDAWAIYSKTLNLFGHALDQPAIGRAA
jgi:hypothetical protein